MKTFSILFIILIPLIIVLFIIKPLNLTIEKLENRQALIYSYLTK